MARPPWPIACGTCSTPSPTCRLYTEGKSYDDYLADDMRRHAVERCLEIVSEASRHLPREAKAPRRDTLARRR